MKTNEATVIESVPEFAPIEGRTDVCELWQDGKFLRQVSAEEFHPKPECEGA